jgi:hypothetical protein
MSQGRLAISWGRFNLDILAVSTEPENEALQILAFTWRKEDVKRTRSLLLIGKTVDNQVFVQYLFHFNHVFKGKR